MEPINAIAAQDVFRFKPESPSVGTPVNAIARDAGMRAPNEPSAGSNFSYESDIAPITKRFFQNAMRNRNLNPMFTANLSSQLSTAINTQAEKDQQIKMRELQYQSSLFSLEREREKAARERRNLQDMAPLQSALETALDPNLSTQDQQRAVGRLGIQYAGLIGESPGAAAAYRAAAGSIVEPTKPKTTAGAFISAGGSNDYLKAYEAQTGIPLDADTELPFGVFTEGLQYTQLQQVGEKDRRSEAKRLRDDIEKRADSLVSDLKNADLLADDLVDKTKRNPNFFDNDYSAAVVEGTIEMFGTPEERKIATGADAATKLKLAQRIGGDYRLGKRLPNTAESAAKASVQSLFTK
jgi:hypothetical protein